MKSHISSIIHLSGIFQHKSWISGFVVLLLMGLSVSSAAALDRVLDPVGQVESSPGPISTRYNDQFLPQVTYASGANEYLVVWEDVVREDDYDIYAIRVAEQGIPIYSEIQIGVSARMDTHPDVAYSPYSNEYLVVWENEYSSTDHDIFAQRVDINGNLVGGEIHVAYTGAYDRKPVVVYNPWTYEYLVVFERRLGSDEFIHLDIMAQRLTVDGLLMGGEITIANDYLDEQLPAVACDGINYLVVWQGDYSEETNIYGQRVQYDGTLIGYQFDISSSNGDQLVPQVAYNSDDAQYFIAWEDHQYSPHEINGQRMDSYGNLIGNQISVAAGGSNHRANPDVAYMDSTRSYLVVWQVEYSSSDHDIYSRRVAFDGSQPEAEAAISSLGSEEKHPALASNSIEQGLVVWEDWRNYSSTGVDIYGSLETVYVPVLSGVVYQGDPGDYSTPLPGIMVELGCSNDQGYFGTLISWAWTDAYGQYFLPAYNICEYYNIVETDPVEFFSTGSQTTGGVTLSSNWIYYNYPLTGKVFTGNYFWDKPEGPGDITPPGNWANFEPVDWANVHTVPVSEQVQDTQTGLDVSTAIFQYSIDGGDVWSGWMPASITGNDWTTQPQTISANVPFGQDSGPDSHNRVMFQVQDMAGNTGTGPEHVVRIDSVPPTNPTSISSPTHTPYMWSNNQYITVQWSGASDERSGIYGYSTSFDQNPFTIPDIFRDTEQPFLENYAYLDSSGWWFHVRTLDNAGNAASGAVHYGPFPIDTETPTAWMTSPGGQVNVPTISVSWAGGDGLSGVYLYDVQTNTNGAGWIDWLVETPSQSASFTGLNGQDVSFRVRACDYAGNLSSWSSPITVTFGVTVTVNVRNEAGQNLLHAKVYRNHAYMGMTDSNGNITLPYTMLGDQLSALMMVYVREAGKPDHTRDGSISWGWRVYITSVKIPNDGTPQLFQVTDTYVTQQLTVRKDQALIGVHIIIVVGWDTSADYLEDLRQGVMIASSYLYDVTDGQFFYETVEIFDNGENGPANDMYIYTDNTVWPNAFIGAIEDVTGRMMFPPIFGGPWANKHAYSTMIHEFGHYGLWLFDEYLKRDGSGGGFCTFNRDTATEETRASIMQKPDNASELCSEADPNHLHNSNTAQDVENNGETTWETVMRVYKDTQSPGRWTLQSPDTRQVPVVPGPTQLPVAGWMNVYVDDNVTGVCAPFTLLVTYPDTIPVSQATAWVGASVNNPVYPQGLTDDQGKITIRGAYNGDILYGKKDIAIGSMVINCSPSGQAGEQTQTAQQTLVITPYPNKIWMKYIPLNDHIVELQIFPSGGLLEPPQAQLWQDGAADLLDISLSYDSGLGAYIGQATLNAALDLRGSTQVEATFTGGNAIVSQVPFMLQTVNAEGTTTLKSGDGQMEILLPAGSMNGSPVVSIQAASQANLHQGALMVIGSPYEVTVSDGQYSLQQPAMLNIHFSASQLSVQQNDRLGLYQWEETNQTWVLISTDIDAENQLISAQITELGTYAIMAPPIYIYNLPIINK